MNGFMLYMSGNSVQIFSVMVTVMLLINAIKAIMAIQQGTPIASLQRHLKILFWKG
jgi:hypothetical protein